MLRPSYLPEISGGTHLAVDLVEDMIKNGMNVVLVVPGPFRANEKVKKKYKKLKIEKKYQGKLIIHRINVSIGENNFFLRALRMLIITSRMFGIGLKTKKVKLIMSHSMPPFLGPVSILLSKLKRAPVLYWEQDIVSESLISTGVASEGIKKRVFYTFARMLEKITSRKSDHVITISKEFKKRQLYLGKLSGNVDVVYNWIDVQTLKPIPREKNIMFQRYNLNPDNFYVTYCGNLGIPQNVEILVDAARELQHITNLKFLIFGNGVRKENIENYIKSSQVKNIQLLPLQPLNEADHVYSVGEVGVVIGRSGTAKNGFPSKTWSIMAAGQAIVSCFDTNSELSYFVRESNSGISVPPDNSEALKNAILDLYNNPLKAKEYGENARNYVTSNFSRSISTEKIIKIAKDLINS